MADLPKPDIRNALIGMGWDVHAITTTVEPIRTFWITEHPHGHYLDGMSRTEDEAWLEAAKWERLEPSEREQRLVTLLREVQQSALLLPGLAKKIEKELAR